MTLILSLDDDQCLLDLYQLILRRTGYELLQTRSSREAMLLLHSKPIDVFTQDVMRPDMDGLEFYRFMKADVVMRAIPVLFISAGVRLDFITECRSIYGDDYITKPFLPRELTAALDSLLTRRLDSPNMIR